MNKNNTVRQAGGFILQIMPGIDEDTICALENRIGEIDSITSLLEKGMTPEDHNKTDDMNLQVQH